MEPKLPSPDRSPETRSADVGERRGSLPPISGGEMDSQQLSERKESVGEAPASHEVTHVPAPILSIPAQLSSDDSTTTALPQVSDDAPVTASNNDVIEKEWVDSAKRIIVETRDDPYRREQKVKELQRAYLDKRYGKMLGSSRD